MHKLAVIRKSAVKEITTTQPLTIVHQQKNTRQKPDGKYKTWVMPPLQERYIKHKNHDSLSRIKKKIFIISTCELCN
jgi:hypothetical protein